MKTNPGDTSFNTSAPKIMIICFTVPKIRHVRDVIIIFHFGQFFALFAQKNQNFKNMKKTPGDNMCTKNYDKMMYGS